MRLRWLLTIACVVSLSGCASYRPAPLSVRVTSEPAAAQAELRCPNLDVRKGTTPFTFRIPRYATPCALTLSKEGFRDKHVDVTLNLLQEHARVHSGPAPARAPIQFEENATPFSLLGALIVRGLQNLGDSVSERLSTAVLPDAELRIVLEAESR